MLLKQSFIAQKTPQIVIGCAIVLGFLAFYFLYFWQHPIVFTPRGNFYAQSIAVSLDSYFPGRIRYTVDGTVPTADSLRFTQEIELTKPSMIRAAVFIGNWQVTKEQAHDFFVNTAHQMSIVSLQTEKNRDKDAILSREQSFFAIANYYELADEPNQGHKLSFQHRVRVKLHGESLEDAPQQSLRLEMVDDGGGEKEVHYPFFGAAAPTVFTSVILRNDDPKFARLREQVANEIAQASTDLDVQRGKPVVLYINGDYFGLYFLRDRFDETYFVQKYGLKAKALALIEIPLGGTEKGKMVPSNKKSVQDAAEVNTLLDKIARCIRCMGYSVVDTTLDVANLTDYLLLQLYFANYDWPYNNYKAWRYRNETWYTPSETFVSQLDGRFRFLFFDSDVSFGAGSLTQEKMVRAASGDPYAQFIDNAFPFRNLFYSPTFAERYRNKLEDLLATELNPENTDVLVDRFAGQIRSEMPAQIERWKNYNTPQEKFSIDSMEAWEAQVELLKVYLKERPAFFSKHTQDFFTEISQ